MTASPLRLALVDDHVLFRKGLASLIRTLGDSYQIVVEAGSGDELIMCLQNAAQQPDLAIVDINMPGKNGFETVAWLNKYAPLVKVLIVSMLDREEVMVRMLRIGVRGYLSKDVEPEDLRRALNAIHQKGFYYTDFVTGRLLHELQRENAGQHLQPTLTEKEIGMLRWMCTELSYKEIANNTNLSVKTIDAYKETLCRKTNSISRVGLVMYAIRNKIVEV